MDRDEQQHFVLLVNTIQKVLTDIVRLREINIVDEFSKMCQTANIYLDKKEKFDV